MNTQELSHGGNALMISRFVSEGKQIEAAKALFALHKSNFPEWVETRDYLLSMAGTSKMLNTYASLLEVSKCFSLDGMAYLVPGLSSIDFKKFYKEINYVK